MVFCFAGREVRYWSVGEWNHCFLDHCASVENNITVYVCITMPMVIKIFVFSVISVMMLGTSMYGIS